MTHMFLALFLILASFNWLAAWRERVSQEYLVKPGAIVALMLLASARSELSFELALALGLCMLGDIFLMLPGDYFMAGLLSFLGGHLAYTYMLSASWPDRLFWFAVVAAAVSPVAYMVLKWLAGRNAVLRLAVIIYMSVIVMMAASAIASGNVLAAVGALTFVVSDAVLAYDRFVARLPRAHFAVMVTYHLAQLALVLALS